MSLAERFPTNPDYGSGAFRRRIDVGVSGGAVRVILDDDFHSMTLSLGHRAGRVATIEAMVLRAPYTTCPSAPMALHRLVGLELGVGRRGVYGDGRSSSNCTHLLDMALLAMGCASRQQGSFRLDLIVPDMTGAMTTAEALVGGQVLLRWQTDGEIIVGPGAMAGVGLFGGFEKAARSQYDGQALDVALGLQKALFVSRGRRYLLNRPRVGHERPDPKRLNACFTFSEPHRREARVIGNYDSDLSTFTPPD